MTTYQAPAYDVCVVGAGHAGIEAALAAARLGCSVICFATNLDAVGNLPCNPAIGGTAKGHLVREIDALGGEMAKAADACCIQVRMLNRSKGPAVHSLRGQADRVRYQAYMKHALETQPGLSLRQAEVVSIEAEGDEVRSVTTATGAVHPVKSVVVATGTFLRGRVIIGEYMRDSGPDGLQPASALSRSLLELGLPLQRFKTGTPPRILAKSVDYSRLHAQLGDEDMPPFSFSSSSPPPNLVSCWVTHTTAQTHDIIRANLHRSPLYAGVIEGVGPRYCPSIEDKIVRFADKESHHLFLEPVGLSTDELYLQGLSSSLPEQVQMEIVRSIPGLERAEVSRPAYAIEYDCLDPLALRGTLELKTVGGLFGAGQFCATSGYEEAAALGLVAGVNAAHRALGRPAFTLERTGSYIGTMIDDLVTRGTAEPYRMMTSRSEVRLLLRQDNADLRLMPIGYQLGLIKQPVYDAVTAKADAAAAETQRLEKTVLPPSEALNEFLASRGSSPVTSGVRLADLVRRPELGYDMLAPFDPDRPVLTAAAREQTEIGLRYEGYLRRQRAQVEQATRMEHRALPSDLEYGSILGLRIEARQKLAAVRPASLGQAARIPGVNPADLTALMIELERRKEARDDESR